VRFLLDYLLAGLQCLLNFPLEAYSVELFEDSC